MLPVKFRTSLMLLLMPNHPFPTCIAVAVVAEKLAGTFKLAVAPKIIPAGLRIYKLEFPPVT